MEHNISPKVKRAISRTTKKFKLALELLAAQGKLTPEMLDEVDFAQQDNNDQAYECQGL
jgi:hypothetical protein